MLNSAARQESVILAWCPTVPQQSYPDRTSPFFNHHLIIPFRLARPTLTPSMVCPIPVFRIGSALPDVDREAPLKLSQLPSLRGEIWTCSQTGLRLGLSRLILFRSLCSTDPFGVRSADGGDGRRMEFQSASARASCASFRPGSTVYRIAGAATSVDGQCSGYIWWHAFDAAIQRGLTFVNEKELCHVLRGSRLGEKEKKGMSSPASTFIYATRPETAKSAPARLHSSFPSRLPEAAHRFKRSNPLDYSEQCFFTWILDDECISHKAVHDLARRDLPIDEPGTLGWAFRDSSLWVDKWLPEPCPENTLRKIRPSLGGPLSQCRLWASTYQGSGNPLDIKFFQFFGLWDPVTQKLVYRTRHGFQVFAHPDDPAAGSILNRPIGRYPGSSASLEKISSWLWDCQEHHDCKATPGTMPARVIEVTGTPDAISLRLRRTEERGPQLLLGRGTREEAHRLQRCLVSD